MNYSARILVMSIAVVFLLHEIFGTAFADDALVLPKGTWRFLVEGQYFFPTTQRFNKDGKAEDIAKDFNTDLNSDLLPDLQPLDPFVPGGKASIGHSSVAFELDRQELHFQPAYGLTDKLSIGMEIPYLWQKNTVQASVDPSTANVGKSVNGANTVVPPCPCPLTPLNDPFGFGDVQPLNTDDVQNLLGSGLTVGSVLIPGFGFKRVETWSDAGVGDIDIGARYQYFKSETWRLAFTGAGRLPTGKVDDPDNLVDRSFGTGTYALLFRFHQDFVRQPPGPGRQMGIPEPGSFVINTTFRYDLYLPDKETLRVCSIHNPVCNDKDDVRRDIGDVVEAEISGSVGLLKGLFLSPLYKFGHAFKDQYSGDKGFDYGSLATETDYNEHIFKVSLIYSTVPLFIENKFPFPLTAGVNYRNRFAGNNNLNKSQYLGFTIAAFF